jgi:hypothetical protein
MKTSILNLANKKQLNTSNAYDLEFIAKIEKSKKEIKDGKGIRIKVDDLWR